MVDRTTRELYETEWGQEVLRSVELTRSLMSWLVAMYASRNEANESIISEDPNQIL